MSQEPAESTTRSDGRIPRGAIVVVIVGLVASLGVFGLSKKSGGSSAELEWDVKEPIRTPVEKQLGANGSLRLARTSVSAIAPNANGELIYRVSGVVTIDSGGKVPTMVRCDIATTNGGESMIARTPNLRAAWPRPSDDLQRQEVPETAVVKFHAAGASVLGLPIRDVFRRYTDSAAPTIVEWDGYEEKVHNWIWKMENGTGPGPATLGYSVIFKTAEQPVGLIDCKADLVPASGNQSSAEIRVPVKLDTWPVPDSDDSVDVETGADVPDVE
ncbi:MAG: hypothetical protein M3Y45_00765 [Actinomycetota bacterium]|nr:hypothetical protein [Actinomycetota bacterium]